MLNVKSLDFAYNKDEDILIDLNLKIKKGELIGFINPNAHRKLVL